jgi:hypothetical protein
VTGWRFTRPSRWAGSRELWLHNMRRLLTSTADALKRHRWWILRPHPGSHWFTSDHPVVRLNYYGNGRYDLKGGWGNSGAEIIVPLSPTALMYTKIGDRTPRLDVLNADHTLSFQRFVAERARRWIIARSRPQRALMFRERVVDRDAFQAEERLATVWHQAQADAERRRDVQPPDASR